MTRLSSLFKAIDKMFHGLDLSAINLSVFPQKRRTVALDTCAPVFLPIFQLHDDYGALVLHVQPGKDWQQWPWYEFWGHDTVGLRYRAGDLRSLPAGLLLSSMNPMKREEVAALREMARRLDAPFPAETEFSRVFRKPQQLQWTESLGDAQEVIARDPHRQLTAVGPGRGAEFQSVAKSLPDSWATQLALVQITQAPLRAAAARRALQWEIPCRPDFLVAFRGLGGQFMLDRGTSVLDDVCRIAFTDATPAGAIEPLRAIAQFQENAFLRRVRFDAGQETGPFFEAAEAFAAEGRHDLALNQARNACMRLAEVERLDRAACERLAVFSERADPAGVSAELALLAGKALDA